MFYDFSGVLTGSTCSESSSNSGTSDITDPCSPYSVNSFHLGDDNGSPLAVQPKSSSFANSELLVDAKMLPEHIPREEESEVSCWAWDKTIDWNERFELTSDDIDVEVKNTDYYDDSIDDKHDENNDEENAAIKISSACCIKSKSHDSKTIVNGKLNFNIPLVERKSLNSIDNYHGKDLNRALCKNSLKLVTSDTASRKVFTENTKNFALPNGLNIDDTQNYFYDKVFQQKRVITSVDDFHQLSVFDENTTRKPKTFREHECEDDEPSDITASKSDDSVTTNKFFVKNSYPLDFFNILPSVFKGPILHSDDHDDYNECESGKATCADEDDGENNYHFLGSAMFTCSTQHDENSFCRSKLKNLSKNIVDDISNEIVNNNNNSSNINNNNKSNNNNNLSSSCLVKAIKPKNLNVESEVTVNDPLKIHETTVATTTTTTSTYQERTRFPSDRKSSFISDRICRWTDCVDHVSSSAKLIEHLQVGS